MAGKLRDVDTANRAFLFRALAGTVPTAAIIAGALAFYLRMTRGVSFGMMAMVVLGGVAFGVAAGFGITAVAGRIGETFVAVVSSAGNIPPAPSFSFEESLVARGRYQEAVESFQAHLASHPEDHAARLALAAVVAGPLGDPAAAARVYHEIRMTRPGPALEYRVSQALIDLYRAAGDRGRLLAELARFAEAQRGTAAGAAARRELLALKAET